MPTYFEKMNIFCKKNYSKYVYIFLETTLPYLRETNINQLLTFVCLGNGYSKETFTFKSYFFRQTSRFNLI